MCKEKILLDLIQKEIEEKMDCKVVSIRFAQILSWCVRYKAIFNEDFLYEPKFKLGSPETICFSERSMNFTYRVDLFDCMKKNAELN